MIHGEGESSIETIGPLIGDLKLRTFLKQSNCHCHSNVYNVITSPEGLVVVVVVFVVVIGFGVVVVDVVFVVVV